MAEKATMVKGKVKKKYGHLYYIDSDGNVMDARMRWNKS